jgi:hypothetical protein
MKAQFDQNLLSSFYLWFENKLLKEDFKAYIPDLENTFEYVEYSDLPSDYIGYQGQFRQLVAENNVDSPNSGVFINGDFVSADVNSNGGVYIDHQQGRVVLPLASGTDLEITGQSTVKEVNTYISNDSDLNIILQSDFIENGQSTPYFFNQSEKLDEKTFFLPACFISIASSENEEHCFGGMENTKNRIRVLVLTRDNFVVDSVISKFRDSSREYITHIPYEDFPYGFTYSLKSFPYEYDQLKANHESGGVTSYIDNVNVSKVYSERLRELMNRDLSAGLIDFDLSTYRFPRL